MTWRRIKYAMKVDYAVNAIITCECVCASVIYVFARMVPKRKYHAERILNDSNNKSECYSAKFYAVM